ncbi:MAG: preprotein translocase subunit SecG [Burkholderiales bacterium]|nr:preprotein translocase subunit SecG [Burkholderiales bacterium]
MSLLESFLLVLYLAVAVTVCGLILLQHGKGADMGAAFGSGSSGSLFGAAGSANFLSRTTAVLAAVFFATSLGLTYLGSMRAAPQDAMQQGVMSNVPAPQSSDVPTLPPASAPATVPAPTMAPTTAPAPTPATGTAPAGTPSKAGEVPK